MKKNIKICMTIYSNHKICYKDVINYIHSIIGGFNKFGFIEKFNNSYGYKKVDSYAKNGIFIPNEIDCPDDYISPASLFSNSTFLNKEKEIMSFIVPLKDITHDLEEYSYSTMDILIKFQNFLYKIFDDIKIEFIYLKEDFVLPLKDFALGHFMNCLASGDICETEFSAHRLLKEKEISYILHIVNQLYNVNYELQQFYCDTCYSYNKNTPYHIQLDMIR